ncbi:hypothetical protein NX784_05325 [Massilia pinisoli]|uniref:Uncharacterized protein n=1 Tax=Massilia pinisoli TaxID=1772194 RepID=A0ABT1ZM61_9BURK|nr:hypothetical protein [Massilia pinisoli]MCS0581003.1 hypothetical protein [Massilia pinisoli]
MTSFKNHFLFSVLALLIISSDFALAQVPPSGSQTATQSAVLPESSLKVVNKSAGENPLTTNSQSNAVQSGNPSDGSAQVTAVANAPEKSPHPDAKGVIVLTPVSPDSDRINYMGDQISYPIDIYVARVDMSVNPHTSTALCAPARSRFKGAGQAVVSPNATPSPIFRVVNVGPVDTKVTQGRCTVGSNLIQVGDVVVFAAADLKMIPPDRFGLTYGTLLVPYKYHFSGSDFGSGASVGGYLGYRWDRSGVLGIALQPVLFLGAAIIPVSQVSNGQVKTENMGGISYGLGLLGTVKDSFHLGIVIGADRVNKSADYRYNGKPWLAISLGFEFSN